MNATEKEQIRFLAARAAIDSGDNEYNTQKLLEKDYERAKRAGEKGIERFNKVVERWIPSKA